MTKTTLVKEAEEKRAKELHEYKVSKIACLLNRKQLVTESVERLEKAIKEVEDASTIREVERCFLNCGESPCNCGRCNQYPQQPGMTLGGY